MKAEVERLNGLCAVGTDYLSGGKKLVRNGEIVNLLLQSSNLPTS